MPLDPRQPVRVKKDIVTPGGNFFPSRENPYLPGEIPKDFFNEEYCTQKGVQFRSLPDATPDPVKLAPNSIDETLSLKEGQLVVEGESAKINVNFASPDKIAAFIDGAGPKTVEKLDAQRQEKPFTSIEDLEERCPLPKVSGKTWATYKDAISF